MEKARATEGVQDELPHFTVPVMAAIIKAKSQLDRSVRFDHPTCPITSPITKVAVESKQRHNELTL
jgi:hypothetical protein